MITSLGLANAKLDEVTTLAAITTAVGLVHMFLGYKLYRVLATFLGGVMGCAGAVALSTHYIPHYPLLHFAVGLIGVGLGGLVAFYVSIFAFGFVLGVALGIGAAMLWVAGQPEGTVTSAIWLVVYAVTGLAGGVLALLFRRPFLIFLTATSGASMGVQGAAMAVQGASAATGTVLQFQTMRPFEMVLSAVAFVALAGIGIYVQWKTTSEGEEGLGALGKGEKEKPAKKPTPEKE